MKSISGLKVILYAQFSGPPQKPSVPEGERRECFNLKLPSSSWEFPRLFGPREFPDAQEETRHPLPFFQRVTCNPPPTHSDRGVAEGRL